MLIYHECTIRMFHVKHSFSAKRESAKWESELRKQLSDDERIPGSLLYFSVFELVFLGNYGESRTNV